MPSAPPPLARAGRAVTMMALVLAGSCNASTAAASASASASAPATVPRHRPRSLASAFGMPPAVDTTRHKTRSSVLLPTTPRAPSVIVRRNRGADSTAGIKTTSSTELRTLIGFAESDPWTPLYLSSLAGMSTCLGAAVVFLFPPDPETGLRAIGPDVMGFSLALAGSVMITVSAISIGPEVLDGVAFAWNSPELWTRAAAFTSGCGLYAALSSSFPDPEEMIGDVVRPSTSLSFSSDIGIIHDAENWTTGGDLRSAESRRAWRVAMLLFVSLLFHNFPEGLAVAASCLESDRLGLAVAAGILVHNIPEGIAIAVPSLAARPDRPWLAFALASASGLAEPLGALAVLTFLRGGNAAAGEVTEDMIMAGLPFGMPDLLSFVAGVMVMVALIELLPEGMRQSDEAKSPLSFAGGAALGVGIMTATEAMLPC